MSCNDFSVLTLFPEVIEAYLKSSLVGKALTQKLVKAQAVQIRKFATDKHKSVDAPPFGGGEGMVLRPDVLLSAWKSCEPQIKKTGTVYVTPQGRVWNQQLAKEISVKYDRLIIVCGHYEGIDERFIDHCVDEEISMGDYVLTGGELPALVMMDSLARLIPDVIGNPSSVTQDSFEGGLLKYPQYTKPRTFEGRDVPEVLLSGNHKKIAEFRKKQQIERTQKRRPDLYKLIKKV